MIEKDFKLHQDMKEKEAKDMKKKYEAYSLSKATKKRMSTFMQRPSAEITLKKRKSMREGADGHHKKLVGHDDDFFGFLESGKHHAS